MQASSSRRSIAGGLIAVFRHELRSLMYAPLTYIFLIGFLLALGVCVFLVGNFYASDEASIHSLLIFLPWVALIFVPALAMRAWAEGQSDRSLELMLSLPLGLASVVIGKFLAGYMVLLVALAFTSPFIATVFYLGEPDAGVIIAGYLGGALLLACCYAVALFASSFTREQVGGFVGGVGALFLLLLLGWDASARLLHALVPLRVIRELAGYSPKVWFDAIGAGLVELSGIVYLVLVVLLALTGAGFNIGRRRRGASGFAAVIRAVAIGIVVVVGMAISMPLASRLTLSFDFTQEREFTLSRGSIEVLERLPVGTEVTLYWSANEPAVPAAIKSQARKLQRFLDQLVRRSDGRVTVRAVDPQPDTDDELQAVADGLRRVQMTSGDHFFLGATLQQGERVTSIPYFDMRRDRLLEYDIAVALNGLTQTRAPRIGVISSLLPSSSAHDNREGFSFLAELKRAYDLAVIPFFSESLPEGLDVLIVFDASVLKSKMLYSIDQYLMRGGSVIAMMDPFVRFNPPSNQVRPQPSLEINDISDLLLAYGIRYVGEEVVGDAELASPVSDQSQATMSFPFWLRIASNNFDDAHPVTATLNEGLFVEPGELKWENLDGAQALITTTTNSGAQSRREFGRKTPRQLALAFVPDGRSRIIAAALHGPFRSAYSTPLEDTDTHAHLAEGTDHGLLFAVADVDWLFDPFSVQTVDLGGQVITRPLNDNLAFLLNMVEYATGERSLIAMRSRGRLQRPFTHVAELFKSAEQTYREEELQITRKLSEAEAHLAEVAEQAGVADINELPAEFQGRVQAINAALLPMRKQLRDIRRRIREDVERLGRLLTFINLVAGPVMASILAVIVFAARRHRHRVDAI